MSRESAANPELRKRFLREGQVLRELDRPNIVRLLDAFEQDGGHYLAQEAAVMKKWFYEIVYRLVSADTLFGSTEKIENFARILIDGRIPPCKAITLGCGEGRETVYLAKQGFIVTGLDFSPTAIKKARLRARAAGLDIPFIVDDLTNLSEPPGTFDLVMDFGAFNDLNQKDRDLYMENVLPMTRPNGHYGMFCFDRMLPEAEVRERFSPHFQIEVLHQDPGGAYPGTLTIYSMKKVSR